jgi:voltage-gated potassium channel
MRERLDRFLHDPRTELVLAGLILLSATLVLAETWLDRVGSPWYPLAHLGGDLITAVFVVELGVRYALAHRKRRFFRNYWLDVLSVLPLLHFFRLMLVLRLLRLLRVGILLNRRIQSVSVSLAASLGVQLGVFMLVGVIILVGGVTMFSVEGDTNPDFSSLEGALWWSGLTLVSGQPLGGEAHTDAGRFMTLLVILGGMTMFAVFTGVVSAVMVQRLKSGMEVKDLGLDDLREHIVICGWSRSVPMIIEELQLDPATRNRPIAVVAEFSEPPERELKKTVDRQRLFFQTGDYTAIEVLEAVGIPYASQAILVPDRSRARTDQDRDARTVLAALTIEKLNPHIFTVAHLMDRKNTVHLRVAGVEEVIVGDEVSSHLIATSCRNRGLTDVFMELLTVQVGNEFFKVELPDDWNGLTFWGASQRLKAQHDAILVAVERWHEGFRRSMVNPPQDEPLLSGDHLVVISRMCPRLRE